MLKTKVIKSQKTGKIDHKLDKIWPDTKYARVMEKFITLKLVPKINLTLQY